MKYKIGELVKWYDLYETIGVVKSSGIGVLVSHKTLNTSKGKTFIYEVHALKEQKNIFLDEHCVEKINKETR